MYTLYSTDTPEEFWCQVPELQNFTTAAQRKFLSIPLIEVREILLVVGSNRKVYDDYKRVLSLTWAEQEDVR